MYRHTICSGKKNGKRWACHHRCCAAVSEINGDRVSFQLEVSAPKPTHKPLIKKLCISATMLLLAALLWMLFCWWIDQFAISCWRVSRAKAKPISIDLDRSIILLLLLPNRFRMNGWSAARWMWLLSTIHNNNNNMVYWMHIYISANVLGQH